MSLTTTPEMQLVLAAVSETLGPLWAQYVNAALTRVDAHDHTEGNGVKINQAAVELTGDFDLLGYALLNALTVYLNNIGSAVDVARVGTLQRVGQNLWWVNSAGVGVQITNGSAVVSPGTGAITLAGPASFPYTVLPTDTQKVLIANSSTGAKTFILPPATTAMYVMIKDSGGAAATNNISVVPDGTDSIDGLNATYKIDADYMCAGFISDGVSNWYVV